MEQESGTVLLWASPDTPFALRLKALFRFAFLCRSRPTIWAKKKAGARGTGPQKHNNLISDAL
jgi:hypothetical protein